MVSAGRSTGAGANKQQQPQQQQQNQQQQRSEQRGNQNTARRNANQAAMPGASGNREYQPRNNAASGGSNTGYRSYNSVVGGGSGNVSGPRSFNGGRPNMGYNNRGGMRNGFRGPGGYRPGNGPSLKFADMPIPKQEFDFEEANKQFTKLEEQMSELKVNGNSADEDGEPDAEHGGDVATNQEHKDEEPSYNKTKSFFDTISCEALEREKGYVFINIFL